MPASCGYPEGCSIYGSGKSGEVHVCWRGLHWAGSAWQVGNK